MNPETPTAGETPLVDSATDPGASTPTDGTAGTEGGEGYKGYGGDDGEGGSPARNPKKATDIPGVKEGTAEFTAVSLILKVTQGQTEGLQSLIAEDVNGLLKELRGEGEGLEKALAEGKEMIGQVKPVNSRLVDRDTVVTFQNNHEKVLQFYVRKIQGEYFVREIRVKDAVKPAVNRRRD
jgi:hypothetical protein